MERFEHPLASGEIENLRQEYGNYMKLTIDIENDWVVAGESRKKAKISGFA